MLKLLGILATVSLVLVSCSGQKQTALNANFQTVTYLNPNVKGEASPVVVTLYQLRNDDTFKQADFFDLQQNPANVLGNNLLDRQSLELRPNEQRTVNQNLAPDTRYVGVLAAYRDLDQATWREIIEVPEKGKLKVNITLASQGIQLG